MTTTLPATAAYALRLGDDALVLAQRLGEWVARAPQLEEDVALANIALDLLGQARALLSRAGELEGAGRDEDDLAFLRDADAFACAPLVELPVGDFAVTMARQLVFSTYQRELYAALRASDDEVLAGVAGKAVKEVDYHRDHATQWVLRLGDGTPESAARMQAGLEVVWPHVGALLATDDLVRSLPGTAVDPATLRPAVDGYLDAVLAEARLRRPAVTAPGPARGEHTEHLAPLLAEMQELHRAHPGATW